MKINYKEVPDWDYPEHLRPLIEEFEETVEEIRDRIRKADRNLVAGRKCRTLIQKLRGDVLVRLRKKLFEERDRLEALRHGMTVNEWNRYKKREKRRRT